VRLHLIGLFHTITSIEYSHCAFTGKVLRFPKMMQLYGYEVIEYSNEGSESTADKHVVMLTKDEFNALYGNKKAVDFHGDNATVGSEGHTLFEKRLVAALKENLEKEDIICHPFGHAHSRLLSEFPEHQHVETGIGYPTLMPNSFRIFESYAWMHYHQGKEDRQGSEGRRLWRQEEALQEQEGELRHLHLQGFEASASQHWYLQEGHVHLELLHQRYLRETRT
jgi:hypothetical protein